ncbi:MAG: PAS domain-containing protein, partial [Nostoc sp.]
VISTDMVGRIVTINDAALELLGSPIGEANTKNNKLLWEQNLIGRLVWEVVPIENLQMRLEDSLKTGAKHYVPEQSLIVGLYQVMSEELGVKSETQYSGLTNQHSILAVRDRTNPDIFIPWNLPLTPQSEFLTSNEVQTLERNINLTVNPLTNPEGSVRGGLVVLEDITQEKR